jgi:hypothetical protein
MLKSKDFESSVVDQAAVSCEQTETRKRGGKATPSNRNHFLNV